MKKKILISALFMRIMLTGCTNNNKTLPEGSSKQSIQENMTNNSGQASKNSSELNEEIKITLETAIQSYEEIYPKTSITSIELDASFGNYYYEITGVDDTKEYEIKVNALSGNVSKEREEALDKEDKKGSKRENDALDLTRLKTLTDINKIAEKTIGEGTAKEWTLERELTITYWEVKVKSGIKESTVKINAQTGEVLETEKED